MESWLDCCLIEVSSQSFSPFICVVVWWAHQTPIANMTAGQRNELPTAPPACRATGGHPIIPQGEDQQEDGPS